MTVGDDISVKQRVDLEGTPWQVDVIVGGNTRSFLIDSAKEMQRILMLPRGELPDDTQH